MGGSKIPRPSAKAPIAVLMRNLRERYGLAFDLLSFPAFIGQHRFGPTRTRQLGGHMTGSVVDENSSRSGVATGAFKYDARQMSDLKARIYGESAVVTGRATQTGTENHRDYSGIYPFTRVYVRQRGRWVTVACAVNRPASKVAGSLMLLWRLHDCSCADNCSAS